MAHPGSQRAEDLDAKLWTLRQRHGPAIKLYLQRLNEPGRPVLIEGTVPQQ